VAEEAFDGRTDGRVGGRAELGDGMRILDALILAAGDWRA